MIERLIMNNKNTEEKSIKQNKDKPLDAEKNDKKVKKTLFNALKFL